jgi:hypothetical protein
MTQYADTRARTDAAPASAASAPRLSIARRSLLDLPLAPASRVVPGAAAPAALPAAADVPQPASVDADTLQLSAPAEPEPDFDFGTTFDVPAFLRRQEG